MTKIALLVKDFDIEKNVLALTKDGQIKEIDRKDRFAVFKAWLGGQLDSKKICDTIAQADVTALNEDERTLLDRNLKKIESKFSHNKSKEAHVNLSMTQLRDRISKQYPVMEHVAEGIEEKKQQVIGVLDQKKEEASSLIDAGVELFQELIGIETPPVPVEAKSDEEEEIYQLVCSVLDSFPPREELSEEEAIEAARARSDADKQWRAMMGFPDPEYDDSVMAKAQNEAEVIMDEVSERARILQGRVQYTAEQVASVLPDMPPIDLSGVQLPSVPDFELPDMPSVELPMVPPINTAPVEEVAQQILGFCDSVIEELSARPVVIQESKEHEAKAASEVPFWWKDSKSGSKKRTPEIAALREPSAEALHYKEPELIVPTEVFHHESDAEDVPAESVLSVDADAILTKGSEMLGAVAGLFAFSPAVPQTLREVRAELQKAEYELTGITTKLTNIRSMLEANDITQMEQEKTRLEQWIFRLQEQEKALTAKDEPSAAAQAFKAFTGWSW